MQIKVNDIFLIKKELWISQKLIIENLGYSEEYLRVVRSLQGERVQGWENQKLYGVYYYRYYSIPKRERLGDIDILKHNSIELEDEDKKLFEKEFEESCISNINKSDVDYYKLIIRERAKSKSYKEEDSIELGQMKSVIEQIQKYLSNKEINISKQEMWETFFKVGVSLCPRFLKIKNLNAFRNKYSNLTRGNLRENIIPKNIGNQHTRKVGKQKLLNTDTGEEYNVDIHEVFIYSLYSNLGKMNKLFVDGDYGVYGFYLKKCKEEGIDPVSLSTIKNYINQNKYWLTLERDGKDEFNNKWKPYIPQEKPKYAGSIWVADWSGSKLLYYDKYKKELTSLYIFRIVDVATEKIMGWSLGEKGKRGEKSEYMIDAIKMAVNNNGGYGCYEFKTDNGTCFTSEEGRKYIKSICIKHTRIELGNKQSNKAETFIRKASFFVRQYENWQWTGFNSRNNNAVNRYNEDYFKLENMPNKEQAIEQWKEVVERLNNHYGKEASINEKLTILNEIDLRKVFGNYSQYDIKRCRGVIELRKEKIIYYFDVYNYAEILDKIRSYNSKLIVDIYWNENKADIWYEGKYIDTLDKCKKAHNTIAEATDITKEALLMQKEKKNNFISKAEAKRNLLNEIGTIIGTPEVSYNNYGNNGITPKEVYSEYENITTNKIIEKTKERKFKRKG